MRSTTFRISDYIRPEETFHFARKNLAKRFPDRAHDHDFFEVFLIENGCTTQWINGVTQTLEPGQLVFIRPQDTHAFRADRKLGCQIINVMFRVETAEHLSRRYTASLGDRFFTSKLPVPEPCNLGPAQFERAVSVALQLQTAERSLARIEEFLLTLTHRVADVAWRAHGAAPRWFTDACSAALTQAVFRRGAAGFIDAAGRSHEHVCRTCKASLGLTPSEYINRIRVEHAAHLLRSDDHSIEDVAYACGFENSSYFYRLFRRQYGTSPRKYRIRYQRDPFETSLDPSA